MIYLIMVCSVIGVTYLIFNYGGHMYKSEDEIHEEMFDEIEEMKKYNNSN